MKSVVLADDLTLPLEAATQTFLIVGKRGSGKTSTAVRLAEQLHHCSVPFVVLDVPDVWWGLKAARDGKGPGLSVYVFGGRHADLPLEPTAGALIADVLIEHRISAVVSVKHFSGRERGRFVGDFAQRLFQRNREPLHVFLEEAHEVAPQNPYKGEEEMLGHVARIWKLGRSSGLGGSAITQRPASLSKNITTQAEILVVHRTLGPQDVAAIREWIRYHGEREDILAQLATLKTGEAFIWAPDFPEGKPIGLRRVRILERETFDSSATPKAGERQAEPKALAPVDLDRLRTKMAATIEKTKAEDPRELRRRIAELEAAVRKAQQPVAKSQQPAPAKERRVEVPVLKDAQVKRLEFLGGRVEKILGRFDDWQAAFAARGQDLRAAAAEISATVRRGIPPKPILSGGIPGQDIPGKGSPRIAQVRAHQAGAEPAHILSRPPAVMVSRRTVDGAGGDLPRGERIVLTAIAQHPDGVTREQLTVLTGYKRSTRDLYLQVLQRKALVELAGAALFATSGGMEALGIDFAPLPTGDALREYWLARLPEGERRVLEVVIGAYPKAIDRDAISGATGYRRSTRDLYLQLLARRKLVITERGQVRAAEALFG